MERLTTCIRCNTPFTPGAHFCSFCGHARDVPETLSTLAGSPRREEVRPPRPGQAKRKPSLPARVLAALFPRPPDE